MTHRFIQVHQMDQAQVVASIARSVDRTIVFCNTKRACDRVATELEKLGVAAQAIHGDLRQRHREKALAAFSEGTTTVLVATDVAARGIHVDDVEVVIHFDPPDDHKTYLHRSGRTARAGDSGLAVSLVRWNEELHVKRLQKRLGLDIPIVEMFSERSPVGRSRFLEPCRLASPRSDVGFGRRRPVSVNAMASVSRPDTNWLHHASTVGVDGIADAVLDACAVHGGVADPASQRILVSEPAGGWANPRLLGWVHEWSSSATERSSRGAYYTPPDFAASVVDAALSGIAVPKFTVDPACGGGVFLLEMLDRLLSEGVAPKDCVAGVAGIEIDAGAASVANLAIRAWQLFNGVSEPAPAKVAVMDSLERWPRSWPDVDLIIGNPPFASPLKSGAIPAAAAAYRNHHSEVLGPYADLAAIHLWRASQILHDGGRLAFVAPVSIVNARDTGRLWERFEAEADAVHVLIPESNPFEASVRVFVPVFEIRRQTTSGRRSLPHAVGEAIGLPMLPDLESAPTLSSICQATSGFRDEFYGLAECVAEEDAAGVDLAKLVTVGSIDVLSCSWGRKPTRFAKARWNRPVVDRSELEGKVARFVAGQRQPKVLVATQTKVLEPVLDPVGDLVGVTPTIVVTGNRPAHVAAVLLAPPVNAIAVQRWFGTGMSDTSLRPTASTLLELPLPADTSAWDAAARLIEETTHPVDGSQSTPDPERLRQIATLMNDAYGAEPAVLSWWLARSGLD